MSESKPIVIAIDGPSASGKSTNARIISAQLGYIYVDTGAMYRTLAWHVLQTGTDVTDMAAVEALCRNWPAKLVDRRVQLVKLIRKTGWQACKTSKTGKQSRKGVILF